ncbi:MAG: succinylglutamate desuccinylase/aspartoacylase family protein [Mesorhizobium sp.]
MTDTSMISSTISFDQEGVSRGYLKVPHSVHRSAYGHIPIPIAVARRGEGPTLLLTGGIHGDEYEGPLVLYDLMRRLDQLDLSGRLIIIPSVNHPAFIAGSRVSPIDQLNMNRVFPGRRDGSVTEMIAHYVSTQVLPLADYVIDCHAGGSSLQYLPVLLAPIWDDGPKRTTSRALIEAFGAPRVVYYDSLTAPGGEDRVMGNAADRNGCHFLSGEFGGGSTVNLEGRAMLAAGIDGVMRHLGLLRPVREMSPVKTRHLFMTDPALFAFAPKGGIFEPAYRLGDELAPGALAGIIHDPTAPWEAPCEVRFEGGGLAICVRTFASVEPGDCLGHLARDVSAR